MGDEQPESGSGGTMDRLLRLERIVAQDVPTTGAAVAAGTADLPPALAERIVRLTTELRQRTGQDPDAPDLLAMRLLLNDYVSAVSTLRAIAEDTNARITGVQVPLKRATRRVKDLLGLEVAGGRPYLRSKPSKERAPSSGNGGQPNPGDGKHQTS